MSNPAPCVGAAAASRAIDRSGEEPESSSDRDNRVQFKDFYTEELATLIRFACSLTGDEQAAEDLVAETMMIILKRWDDLVRWVNEDAGVKRLRCFAFGVVKNLARDLYRTRRRYLLVGESESLGQIVDKASDTCIDMLDVERTLAQMPFKQSQVLWMEMQGFTTAEIAREMDVQESTARTHLASARRHMRERLYKIFTGCDA